MSLIKQIFKSNNWLSIIIISAIYFIAIYIELTYLYTDELYYSSLKDEYNGNIINRIIDDTRSTEWLNYPLSISFILIVSLLTSFCLNLGVLLNRWNLSFKDIFSISLKSHLIFALAYLVFVIIKLNDSSIHLSNMERNDFASILVFVQFERMDGFLYFILQQINLVQLSYLLFLGIGVSAMAKKRIGVSFLFVFCTYGSGFFTLMLLIGLMRLNIS